MEEFTPATPSPTQPLKKKHGDNLAAKAFLACGVLLLLDFFIDPARKVFFTLAAMVFGACAFWIFRTLRRWKRDETPVEHEAAARYLSFVLIAGCIGCAISATVVKNARAKFAIEPQFDDAFEFSQGLAAVRVGDEKTGKWGYIGKTGNFVVKPQFGSTDSFAEGLAAVGVGSPMKWGYIDASGAFVIAPQFDFAKLFSGGYAPVRVGDELTGKWGYIDRQGRFVIPPKFGWANPFVDGLAAVGVGMKFGFIDSSGAFAIQPQFDWAESFSDGLAAVTIDHYSKLTLLGQSKLEVEHEHWYIEKTGNFAGQAHADSAKDFHSGLAAAEGGQESPRKFGYINKSGDFAIAPQFDVAGAFGEGGLAPVCMGEERECGFINQTGSFVIQPKFAWARPFTEGLAAIQSGDSKTGKWGYIGR